TCSSWTRGSSFRSGRQPSGQLGLASPTRPTVESTYPQSGAGGDANTPTPGTRNEVLMQHDRNQRELAATFSAAMKFGLSDEQVWEAAKEVAAHSAARKARIVGTAGSR